MARICGICGKKPQVKNTVSNANNRVKKWVYPNVQRIRYTKKGETSKVHQGSVCTKCVKVGKVSKVM